MIKKKNWKLCRFKPAELQQKKNISMETYEIKVVFLGESGVGKTSIILSFTNDTFSENEVQTIGASYTFKKIIRENDEVKLKIWDTAGQERFRSLAPMYYRDADVAVGAGITRGVQDLRPVRFNFDQPFG